MAEKRRDPCPKYCVTNNANIVYMRERAVGSVLGCLWRGKILSIAVKFDMLEVIGNPFSAIRLRVTNAERC